MYFLKLMQVIMGVQHLWLVEWSVLMTGLLTCSSDRLTAWIIAQDIQFMQQVYIFNDRL